MENAKDVTLMQNTEVTEWKYMRARVWIDYESELHAAPPPLNVLWLMVSNSTEGCSMKTLHKGLLLHESLRLHHRPSRVSVRIAGAMMSRQSVLDCMLIDAGMRAH